MHFSDRLKSFAKCGQAEKHGAKCFFGLKHVGELHPQKNRKIEKCTQIEMLYIELTVTQNNKKVTAA